MKSTLFNILLGCLLLPVLAVGQDSDSVQLKKDRKVAKVQYGTASYYDNKFEGRQTANGEIFSQKNLTAASNTLPLNCWVRVTNLKNNRSVVLRITDRMHRNNKRLIDLSRSAASKLGYISWGLTRARVEFLGFQKPTELSVNKSK